MDGRTVAAVPTPIRLSIAIVPPCASTTRRAKLPACSPLCLAESNGSVISASTDPFGMTTSLRQVEHFTEQFPVYRPISMGVLRFTAGCFV
jgi:hypothetical protein